MTEEDYRRIGRDLMEAAKEMLGEYPDRVVFPDGTRFTLESGVVHG